jgi:small GTP-binding protein
MERDTISIVIAGHRDHGKSTLLGRLLYDTGRCALDRIEEVMRSCEARKSRMEFGFLLDYLQEEREQGITIDTTQVFFSTGKRDYVIVDVPGHREFIRNMMTGASQAEAAVLMVSVDEGIREQTLRHAYILSLLGLSQVIVAINKMDLAGFSKAHFVTLRAEINESLRSLSLRPLHTIPISSLEGDNIACLSERMSWYDGLCLLDALDSFAAKKELMAHRLRFPLQDIYIMGGEKLCVGRVESGEMKEGQEALILPENERTAIVSIRFFGKTIREAGRGESIGVILAGSPALRRGQVITGVEELPEIADSFNATIFWMSEDPHRKGETLNLRCATQRCECSIESIERRIESSTLAILGENGGELCFGEVGMVKCRTCHPIVMEDFSITEELGRIVLERGNTLVAAGVIISDHHGSLP